MNGPARFVRYAFPPCALGYCGPDEAPALLEYADAGAGDGDLVRMCRDFDGAWPYLSLLAESSGIGDPLDPRVVEAYWIGNPLLDRVHPDAFARHLQDRFRPQWEPVREALAAGGVPHHSFHVFCVSPWIGLLRSGRTDAPLHVIDRCRIRPGRVLRVEGDTAVVSSPGLAWDGRRLTHGPARTEVVTLSRQGRSLAGTLQAGDVVAMHWDWVCERITREELARLRRYTDLSLAAANAGHSAVAAATS